MLRARNSWHLRWHLCCALVLVSCGSRAPDRAPDRAPAGDPWSGSTPRAPGAGDKSNDGGFDLPSSLGKIAENLTKPGPYEAPEASTDFDEAKPHWGVLRLRGEIVEREAL